jgi:cytochrome c
VKSFFITFKEKKQMIRQARTPILLSATVAAIALAFSLNASAADENAAKELARANNCFKCHGVDKEKDGPAYKKVAEKYRGKPEAEAKLITHITSGEKAKFPDGHEEDHKNIKGKASPEEIKNLVDWILSL